MASSKSKPGGKNMKKGLTSLILITLLLTILMMVGCIEVLDNTPKDFTTLALEKIGNEGDIRESEVAYELTEMKELGVHTLVVKRDKLQQLTGKRESYSITISGEAHLLTTNPFNHNLLETTITDTHQQTAIKQGHIKRLEASEKQAIEAKQNSSRDTISIASVIIDKDPGENDTTLYRITLTLYLSMRNAHVYIFDTADKFIPPA